MKTAVYPYDFEFASVLKHREMLKKLEIVSLIAPKGFGICGKDAYCYYGKESGFTVCDVIDKNSYNDVDALLITDSVLKIPKEERLVELENVISNKPLVINSVYDSEFTIAVESICQKQGIRIMSGSELLEDKNRISLSKVGTPSERNRINTPIVAIAGLSPMTQKFDLQLYLRHHFMKDGYKVSQIGTREMGYLFGFRSWGEALYTNCFSEIEKIAKINQLVKDIELIENPDVFIIGIPDALMPYTQKHTFRYGIPAFEILNAITPDYMVMSMFNGEYTDDFYEEMVKMCNYKYNADVDCFFNSHFVPISRSINSDCLSYSYGNRNTVKSEKYLVFNSESIDDRDMYECVVNSLANYGKFKVY